MGTNLCCHRLRWTEVKNTRVFPKLGKTAAFIIDSHDRTVVIQTWKKIIQRQNECGEAIFVSLFELFPDTRQFFTIFDPDESIEDLKNTPPFKTHINKFMAYIQQFIECHFNLEECHVMMRRLAVSHKHLNLIPDHFEVFSPIVERTLKKLFKDECTDIVLQAWKNFFKGIAKVMIEELKNIASPQSCEIVDLEK